VFAPYLFAAVCFGLVLAFSESGIGATVDTEAISLPRIPPGTPIAESPPTGWTHLVFKTRSELASGDRDQVPDWAADLTRVLFTAMVARVRSTQVEGAVIYRLEKVAIGLGTRIGNRDVILSSDTQEALGANLGPSSG